MRSGARAARAAQGALIHASGESALIRDMRTSVPTASVVPQRISGRARGVVCVESAY